MIKHVISTQASAQQFRQVRESIECVCGDSHPFSELEKIIVQHYQEPYGCTGGAYWYDGEWNYICPVVGKRVRILFTGSSKLGISYTQAKDIEKQFKRVYSNGWKSEKRVEHEDRFSEIVGRDFFNNHAIDEDPIGYGLARYVTLTETRLEVGPA